MSPEIRNALDQFMRAASLHYDVARFILFGSQAREDAHSGSDVDVAVILEGAPANFADTKLALADLAYDVLLSTGIRIQPLPIWESEWQAPQTYPNPRLLENIAREGRRL